MNKRITKNQITVFQEDYMMVDWVRQQQESVAKMNYRNNLYQVVSNQGEIYWHQHKT